MRIAIVNDLPIAVEAIRMVLATAPQHSVAWVARDGAEAVKLCGRDRPDLILMDLIMPLMDGVAATRSIMAATPCPVLVVTATVNGNSGKVYEALGAGALDAVNTPIVGMQGNHDGGGALLYKIETIGKLVGEPPSKEFSAALPFESKTEFIHRDLLIAIGASAGGPAALAAILGKLKPDLPAAVVAVQHVDAQFAPGLAAWLKGQSALPVRLAREGDRPANGKVLLAGSSEHLVFVNSNSLGYTEHPRECAYRPSVDVFFESVVQHWRGEVVGVLLTGMGRDGAVGLKALRNAGHHTIAQDQSSSAVYGMPKAAAELNAAAEILALEAIPNSLLRRFDSNPNRS